MAMAQAAEKPDLARRLGLFDATMIAMGGTIGSGIFMNPYSRSARSYRFPDFAGLGAGRIGGTGRKFCLR